MAAGHDANVHDDHGHDAHDDHGHGGHDDHGSASDAWVLPPLAVGLIVGLIIIAALGLASGAAAFT